MILSFVPTFQQIKVLDTHTSGESTRLSLFRAKYRKQGNKILPMITGTAHVMAEATGVPQESH